MYDIDNLDFIPPSVLEEEKAAKLFGQVNGNSEPRDIADLAAAISLSQPWNFGN